MQQRQSKRVLTIRVSETGYEHIKQQAERLDTDVAHMVRRMLAYAAANMPEGWVPQR